ncbi:MAG: hypothetical protein U0L26_06385 [Cellulosilyticum sp.]|nr:hypothetical protein [Cellulosilyticum sp.]MEE1072009.1 hypothetical protein [Cellulosilyticum sp.]
MNQQTKQLYAGVAYSYNEYIRAYLDLIGNSMFFSTTYLDEETATMQEELKQYFLTLPELITPQNPQKENCASRLLAIRETLEDKYRTLIAYQRELTLLLTIKQNDPNFIASYFEEIGLDDITPNDIDFSELANDCVNFIFENTSGEDKQKRASSLLPHIPIKITKDNYVNYVRKSIGHIAITNHTDSAQYLISILEQLFDGKSYKGYGKHFIDLKDSLDHLYQIKATDELFEEANLLNETIENCMDMLEKMFRMICTLSNLLIVDKLEFNELTEMHASFFDLYYSIKNILLKTEDYELLLSSLPERLEEIEKELFEDYKKASKDTMPDSLFAFMQTYLNMSMQQIFGFSTAKHSAYSKEVLNVFDDFTNTLREKLNTMPQLERKYRMQYFMSQIPFVMSKENFDAYIHQAFRNISVFAPYLLAANQLTGILAENHYYPEPADTPVMETNYMEDDEAARFIAEHSDLFNDEDTNDYNFFGDDPWLSK